MMKRSSETPPAALPRGAGRLSSEELVGFAVRTVLDDLTSIPTVRDSRGDEELYARLAPGIRAALG